MPIYIDVQSRFDDRSARQAADNAKKYFKDAGGGAGAEFNKALSAGLSSSDAAVRKSAENAEKYFKKAADSAGQARVEEAKLNDLRTKGAGATAMLTQSERLEKARRAETSSTRTAVTALRDLDTAQKSATVSGSALSNLLAGIASGASGTRLGGAASQAESLSTKLGGISPVAVGATVGIAGLAVGAVAAGKALYDLGAAWDDVGDSITGRTGIMGNELTAITDSIKQVGSQSALSFEQISNFAGGAAQTLHLSGIEATAMTQKLADIQQVTGQIVNTRSLGQSFRLFDVNDISSEIGVLQQLTGASQKAQIPINDLLGTLTNAGKAGKEAGLDLQQTLGMVLALEDAGVSFEKAGPALSIALKNWSKDGRDANVALAETVTQIKAFVDAGNDPAATKLATETFGKGYVDFLDAIKGGQLDVTNLAEALKKIAEAGDTIGDQKKAVEDWQESWKKLKNTLTGVVEPAASGVFDFISDRINQTIWATGQLGEKFSNLFKTPAMGAPSTPGTPVTPDWLAGQLGLPGMPGAPAAPAGPGLPTTKPGTPTTGLAPNFYKDWYKTPEELKKDAAQNSKLPDAPVLPYDTSLPQGFAGLPQTSAILSAENSYMDARHTLAEKQARVQQLEQDNNATAADIQKAKNDVVNAQQGQQQAESQLIDARQSLYDKDTKRLKGYADQMGEIGAQLDQDLGISKGLPGMAENLVKFLANLAAAPLLGQLSAVANAPGQAQGGFGLMGVLGAQGVFGSQYTAAGQAAASASSSAGSATFRPGGAYPGDAALLANVPAGRYSQTGSADLVQGLGDCSSAVEDLVNLMDGGPTGGRSMATGNADEWLTQHGFVQGMGGPGDFRVGFNGGHMQATLPGGTPFNWGSDEAAARGGVGGTGADDPAFTSHYYRPFGAAPGAVGGPGFNALTAGPSSGVVPVFVTNMGGGMPGGSTPGGSPASGQGTGLSGMNFDALAAKESGGNWANKSNPKYSGGLQFDQQTWDAYKPPDAASIAADATKEQQIAAAQNALRDGRTPQSLWPTNWAQLNTPTTAPSPGAPDLYAPANTNPGLNNPPAPGAGPVGLPPGGTAPGQNPLNIFAPGVGHPGPPQIGGGGNAFGAGGPGVGPTQIGGLAPTSNPSGGGSGITSGGLVDSAISAAASGLDVLAPGAGQAAQVGIKLANRAIQYGAQAAGIGVSGLLDTFLPSESPLANVGNSWFGKFASGIAGARPALPNMAGKQAPPSGQQGQPGQGGPGQPAPTNNITVNNNRATEDGTGKDVARHMEASNAAQMPGFG